MTPHTRRLHAAALAATLALGLACATPAARAAEPRGIEQALSAAMDSKKGVTLIVSGQQVGGAVVKVDAGQSVELKSQQYGRIVVRLDRIDAVLVP